MRETLFNTLPYEISNIIIEYLPHKDNFALYLSDILYFGNIFNSVFFDRLNLYKSDELERKHVPIYYRFVIWTGRFYDDEYLAQIINMIHIERKYSLRIKSMPSSNPYRFIKLFPIISSFKNVWTVKTLIIDRAETNYRVKLYSIENETITETKEMVLYKTRDGLHDLLKILIKFNYVELKSCELKNNFFLFISKRN